VGRPEPPPGEPSLFGVIDDVINDVKKAPVRFFSVGLPAFCVTLFMEFVLVAGIAALVMTSRETGSTLLALAAAFVGVVTFLVWTFVQLPLEAGVIRHLWQTLHDDSVAYSPKAPLQLGFRKVLRPLSVWVLMASMVSVGLVLGVVPGLLLAASLTFALPAALVDDMGPFAAVKASLAHAKAHPGWHLRLALMLLACGFAASSVPFLGQLMGPPFITMVLLRAYVGAQESELPSPSAE